MEASTALTLVNLVVKNVYTPSQTLALSVNAKTRVAELKQRLHEEFPQQPTPSSQKLIFGGKICGDHELLEQILAPVQSSHRKDGDDSEEPVVFHLLVTSTAPKNRVEIPQTKTLESERQEAVEAADSPRPSHNRVETPTFETPQASATTPFPFHQPAMSQQQQNLYRQSVLMQQQAMVLTQIQYLQYLLMQQRQADSTPGVQHQQQVYGAHFGAPYGNFYGMMPHQMFQAQVHAQPNAAAQAATTPVPAQSAAAAPAEPQERPLIVQMVREVGPLLDFRMAVKMAFMLFIIGQDTPMDRILMLGLLSFISYLHITGIFSKIYEVYNRGRSQNSEPAPNAPADPNAPGAAAAAGAAIAERYGMLTRVLRISPDRGVVQDVKYFVVGLLLSLVPAWHPQPIQGAAPMRENAVPDGAGDVPLQGKARTSRMSHRSLVATLSPAVLSSCGKSSF
ncbi:hypothetical protein BBO99_00004217 [Phytophthora kernoviae]|uniref:Ubiquitin-like domain-containing protein n=2 Tax=Phytophthora kernoviae TaxID=325452 RepID=A0A421ETG9_9STRA|nr:hypothetical protein G195_006711 [Phytophthora kernoviae 00238/432]KAG2525195.1 hypothetical protein JM18_004998 [Phytophthora kernoviae]KAG2525907.1 hypothetical protein JM16_004168 [Phytophthora kernoviae]RLN02029.1 hypothetical protein BBI17_004371 [Phytophthora kernoviae]RLN80817.1 hypothetical protein BBO99_00004217 [Phytophthora kernoviae]